MITTFYSFKGGVGRSFALVEAAAQLARRGHSVVVWDLDLEAPGLQRLPALRPLDDALKLGTLDLLTEFQEKDYEFPKVSLRKAIVDLPHETIQAAGGRLSFLLPAKLDDRYAEKLSRIDWARLFVPKEGPGPAFFLKVTHVLRAQGFEYVLIDSRTGYTDLSAVCTLQLPDFVVLVFNLNEQNLKGIASVWNAITQTPARDVGKIPVFALANMIPAAPADLRGQKLADLTAKGFQPHLIVPLKPEWLLTDAVPSLDPNSADGAAWQPLADAIESRRREIDVARTREHEEHAARSRIGSIDFTLEDGLRRRGIYEKAKSFEEKVADLFRLLGYQATVDYKRDDLQFDIRLEMSGAAVPSYVLVECKDTERPVGQEEIRNFASKVEHAKRADTLPYNSILVARSRFANNAHAVAKQQFVQLRTFQELLLSLVDTGPNVEAAIRNYQGTALERLYVEQDVVLQSDIQTGRPVASRPLTATVHEWLSRPGDTFLALLGDFGAGKTSFCRRLACELALKVREQPGQHRIPVLVDLRESRSTTVSLENILTHHFQQLSSTAFNPQALLHLNREGYLLLIFDGFDEIIGYSDPSQFAENLRQLLRAAEGKAKVLLTCRTHYFRDRPDELRAVGHTPAVVSTSGATKLWQEISDRPDTQTGYLLEFDEAKIQLYLQKALPPPADWQAFRDEIRRTYNLNDLAQRPFLLEIIVKTLPKLAGKGKDGEVTVADLYETYCEEWFRKSDFRLKLTYEQRSALVEYLARLIWESPEAKVHYEVLAEKAIEFFKDRPLTALEKERIDYEVRTALFLNRDAGGYYSFIHRSFLEFFLARTLRRGLQNDDASVLDLRRLTKEVAFFLEFALEAMQFPRTLKSVLEKAYQPRVSENAVLLLYWHACARLGPLVGPGSETQDLSQIRSAFLNDRPKVLQLSGADLSGADLVGIDFSDARLDGADLSRSRLDHAVFVGAHLQRAQLGFVSLRDARLGRCNLGNADLNHIDAQKADFTKANLSGADLSFAHCVEADFTRAELAGADCMGAGLLRARGLDETQVAPSRLAGLPASRDLSLNLPISRGPMITVAWHPSGRVVACGSTHGLITLWDAASGHLLRSLEGHTGFVLSVAWDAAGARLASAADDNTVKLWDAASGRLLRSLEGHTDSVRSVAWDAAGARLASASHDHTVKLWEAASGRLLRSLEGHTDSVWSVAWDAAGARLASAADDTTVGRWRPHHDPVTHPQQARGQPRDLGGPQEQQSLPGGLRWRRL